MKVIPTILIACSLLIISCGQNKQADSADSAIENKDTASIKVYVDAKGTITADAQVIMLEELDKKFQTLKHNKGIVYYSRDNQLADPPKESIEVINLVIKDSLPIKFFSDKTFTQVVEFK